MRPDMAKVIVERPRYGSSMRGHGKGYWRKLKRTPIDELPKREALKRSIGSQSKNLNEHLAPLRRYLLKQVGRPWNKVFAEICEHISRDSAVQDHVRDHVFDYVAVHVFERDGILYEMNWGREVPLRAWRFPRFYVCPQSGRLLRVKDSTYVSRRRSKQLPVRFVPFDFEITFIRYQGVWQRARMEDFPKQVRVDADGRPVKTHDALHGENMTRDQVVAFYGRAIIAREVRRATPAEIRQYCEPLKAPNLV
jgi:hypothetical protein